MRRTNPIRSAALAAWALTVLLTATGADKKVPSLKKEPLPQADETIGDLAFVRANDSTQVEGVGLVVGLNNTGSNPVPSDYRTKLLNTMRKATVPDAERWLELPSTSLVLVRGTIPAGIDTKDRFDIDVVLPPGSTTTSLAGGHLLMTELRVKQIVDGQTMEGLPMGEAYGPIMTGNAQLPDDLRVGRVLGGARVFKDNFYALILKEGRQGFRSADIVQRVINMRFHERKGIDQVGMAVAKRPDLLMLNVPSVYHHNQFRYFQIIERLPLMETPVARAQNLDTWTRELLDPKTAGQAALKLEGIGRNATEALKTGLNSTNDQVQFFAAEALAYLGDSEGVDVLEQAAIKHVEFRAEALAALAALDSSASYLRLRRLMDIPEPELRYGAFNALRTIYADDPFLGRTPLVRDARPQAGSDDMEAMRLHSAPGRSSVQGDDPFELFVVECDGPPMVHVSRSRRREVVVFGRGQKLLLPVAIGGVGSILINASIHDEQIQITRFGVSRVDLPELRVSVRPELGEVIREVANLGATYPEVVRLLITAERQKNLPGPLVLDSVPASRPEYVEAQLAGTDATSDVDPDVTKAGLEGEAGSNPENAPRKRFSIMDRLRRRFDR